jgi:rSAM/selenodomain-associated transferase 2
VTRADRQPCREGRENDLRLSIVVPVLNEAGTLYDALARLQPLRKRGAEVVVVDGGSSDGSAAAARPFADKVLESPRGRALQMNAGGRAAANDVLLFLHADTRLPPTADLMIRDALRRSARVWGRFDIRLSGDRPLLRVVEFFMNQRSRLTAITTGDQAMFVRREVFERLGGFPELPLMEDVALSARLKRESRPLCLRPRVLASSRKWEREGAVRTILLMWWLRLAFFLGANPSDLARRYYGRDGQQP